MPRKCKRRCESCSDAGGAHRRHRAIPAAARATAGGRTRPEPGEHCGVDRDNDGKRRRPRAAGAASARSDGAAVRARAFARRRRATAVVGMVVVVRAPARRALHMGTPTAAAFRRACIANHFGRQVLAGQRGKHPVLDARRQILGPLRDGGRGDATNGFGRRTHGPAQQLKSARFLHKRHVSTLTYSIKGYLQRLKL